MSKECKEIMDVGQKWNRLTADSKMVSNQLHHTKYNQYYKMTISISFRNQIVLLRGCT